MIKRIAIIGPESVGKSKLTRELANWYQTNFVDEYGKIIYEKNGYKISQQDSISIYEGRQSLEDWAIKKSNRLIFCDTEDITTYLLLKMKSNIWTDEQDEWFLKKISEKEKYDLYILLKPDFGNKNLLVREQHYNKIKNELISRECNFVEIGGEWKDRFDESIVKIKLNFDI